MRGLFWLPPARACSARSHQVTVWPHDLVASAAVDRAVAHDARAGDAVAVDQRAAAVAFLGDGAADAWRGVVVAGIAGGEQGRSGVDHEGYAGAQIERSGEEGVVGRRGLEDDGFAWGAAVHGLLNARGVEFALRRRGRFCCRCAGCAVRVAQAGGMMGSVTWRVSWAWSAAQNATWAKSGGCSR